MFFCVKRTDDESKANLSMMHTEVTVSGSVKWPGKKKPRQITDALPLIPILTNTKKIAANTQLLVTLDQTFVDAYTVQTFD